MNAKGANKLYFNIQPGFDDTGERTSEEELEKVAKLVAAAPDLLSWCFVLANALADSPNDFDKHLAVQAKLFLTPLKKEC